CPATGGHASGRSSLAAARQRVAGRPGQDAGGPRPPFLSLRRRREHLRSLSGGRRAGDGLGCQIPPLQVASPGQPGQERRGPVGARKFLGYWLLTDGTLGVAPSSVQNLLQNAFMAAVGLAGRAWRLRVSASARPARRRQAASACSI